MRCLLRSPVVIVPPFFHGLRPLTGTRLRHGHNGVARTKALQLVQTRLSNMWPHTHQLAQLLAIGRETQLAGLSANVMRLLTVRRKALDRAGAMPHVV